MTFEVPGVVAEEETEAEGVGAEGGAECATERDRTGKEDREEATRTKRRRTAKTTPITRG